VGKSSAKDVPRLAILGSSITALAVARNADDLGMRPTIFDVRHDVATTTTRAEVNVVESTRPEAILPALLHFASLQRSWLVATSDQWLRFLVTHRATLAAAFDATLNPGNSALALCLQKAAFTHWCDAQSLPTPPAFDVKTLAQAPETASYPLLIRPLESNRLGRTSVPKAIDVRDAAQLTHWLGVYRDANMEPFITRSLIGRRLTQYSVGAARNGSKLLTFVAIKRRPTAELCGVGTYVELAPDARVEALARSAFEALDFSGIGEAEILRDELSGEDWLIEINCRPWVQYALGPCSGHDLLAFMLDPATFDARAAVVEGRRWLNFADDAYYCFSRSEGLVRHGKISLACYLQSIARANAFAYLSARDLAPFWSTLRRAVKRAPASSHTSGTG
jgi:predicted ATP-grasp superfamily ATP-dependent carboligase